MARWVRSLAAAFIKKWCWCQLQFGAKFETRIPAHNSAAVSAAVSVKLEQGGEQGRAQARPGCQPRAVSAPEGARAACPSAQSRNGSGAIWIPSCCSTMGCAPCTTPCAGSRTATATRHAHTRALRPPRHATHVPRAPVCACVCVLRAFAFVDVERGVPRASVGRTRCPHCPLPWQVASINLHSNHILSLDMDMRVRTSPPSFPADGTARERPCPRRFLLEQSRRTGSRPLMGRMGLPTAGVRIAAGAEPLL